jgi:hypothetical protein
MRQYKLLIYFLHVGLIFCLASSAWSKDDKSILLNSGDPEQTLVAPSNVFTQIQIRSIKSNESATSIQCNAPEVDNSYWQDIAFRELPQNQFFCLRAKINIHRKTLTSAPSLLVGMLGSAGFHWDGQPQTVQLPVQLKMKCLEPLKR